MGICLFFQSLKLWETRKYGGFTRVGHNNLENS
jgi:hypothetical protein